MEVKEITQEEFGTVKKEKRKVLIDCYATWCGPCKMMAPIIDKLAAETEDVNFYKLDIDQAEDVAEEYEITSIPTLLVFENGELKERSIGLKSKEEIAKLIK